MNIQLVFLTCASSKEADKISKTLLDKKLIVCAKKVPVSSAYLWKGATDLADEVLLVMDSVAEKFGEIEQVVNSLHSYESPVLVAISVSRTTPAIQRWLQDELGLGKYGVA